MKRLKIHAVMILMAAFFNVVQAQQLQAIVMSEEMYPIEHVAIIIKNKEITKTNSDGIFKLPNELNIPIKITLEHPDYESLNVIFSEVNQLFYLKAYVPIENLKSILVRADNQNEANSILPTAMIGAEAIDQQSPVDVVSVINQIPGVYIQSGAINTNRIVIRGVGSRTLYGTNKIRGYFDEIPITSGVGETAIDVYNSEDLQSIEIIKGPKATEYGTNLGGTLLLTSKQPEDEGFSIKNSTSIGSYGLFKNFLASDYSNANFNLHITYDHLEQDGYRDNSNYNRNAVFLNAGYRINDKTRLSILMHYIDYTAQIPSSISKTSFEEDPSQAAFIWGKAQGYESDAQNLTGLTLNHRFNENFDNNTSIFYSSSDHYEPRPFNILDEFTNGYGLRTVFNKSFSFLKRKAELTFGGELFKDEYHWKTIENLYQENNGNGSLEGSLLSNNEEYREQLNLFSTVTVPVFEKMTTQFGINYNKTNYDFQDAFNLGENNRSASRNFQAILAPNLNVLYQFNDRQNIFANVSYGFNYPSLEEALTPEGLVNPEIEPEKGLNYEIGSEAYFFKRKWHVLASLYLLNIQDLLVAQRVGDDQYIGRNAGQTIHKGLELSTDYKLILNETFVISPYLNAAFNWHHFKDFVSDDTDFSGNDLTGVPNMTIASGIAVQYKKIAFYTNYLYVGSMPMNDANSVYSDPYSLMNLKLAYDTKIFKNLDLKLNFGINNVFDTTYASSILINATGFNNSEPRYYYPGNPRNYYGGLSLRYHL